MIWSILWAMVIASVYFLPGKDLPIVSFWDLLQFDKVGHFLVFFVFTLILKTGLKRQVRFATIQQRSTLSALAFAIPYGGILEYLQGAVSPDRNSDLMDFVANVAGCLVGIVIFQLIYGRE
ncbi:MAG: VanZ family protein [Flavobacteriales bacterium]|nr:VanZ family protein [Flavobacteriales bacterium]